MRPVECISKVKRLNGTAYRKQAAEGLIDFFDAGQRAR